MADSKQLVVQAQQAFKGGDKVTAKDLLMKAIDLDERNEQAWLWMTAIADSADEKQICLENVLSINPNNEAAQKGLAKLKGSASPAATAPKPTPPPPPAAPEKSDDDLFAGLNFDEDSSAFMPNKSNKASSPPPPPPPPAASPPPPPANDPFGGNPFQDDSLDDNPFGSSDDFGAAPTSPPAAIGSGKQVALPSPEEYDNWIDNMGIGQSNSGDDALAAPATEDDPWGNSGGWGATDDPFGGTPASPAADSTPVNDDPFGSGSDLWGNVDPFGGVAIDAADDPWGGTGDAFAVPTAAFTNKADPFTGQPSTPAFTDSSFADDPAPSDSFAGSSVASAFGASEPATIDVEATFGGDGFAFDEDGSFFDSGESGGEAVDTFFAEATDDIDVGDPFSDLDEPKKSSKKAPKAKAATVSVPAEFSDLPDEFKPASNGSSMPLMAAAVVLLVLNVVAVIGLLV